MFFQDDEIKVYTQKILPSKPEDLSKVVKQIITESSDEFLMACKRTVLEQWSDILNKFDEILEKIITKSNILSFGEKSTSKKQKQTTPKEQKQCQKTPHTEMILSILEMSLMIVKNTKIGYSQYSSLDRLSYLLNSENMDILHLVLQICLSCFKKNSMISKGVVDHPPTFIHKLNYIAKGYGKDSTQFCYDESISDETLKLGTSVKFKVATEDLDNEFRSEEIQEELVIEDVKKSAPDALTLWNDLIKKEGSIVSKLNINKKFDLWTRIRMAFSFYNLDTRRKFLVSRFNSFSVLLYISKKDLLSLEIIPELSKCIEKDKRGELKLPKEVAISMLEFYISVSVFKSSRIQTAALQTLTLTTNTYSGLLQNWLQKLINVYVNGEATDPSDHITDRLYLETLLDLFVSISRTANGSKHLNDSGIANEITTLLYAKDELVVMKCISIVELFLDPKSGVQTSPTVLSDCIKLFSDIIEVSQSKIAKLEESNTEKGDGSSNTIVFKVLSPYQSPTLSSLLRIISNAYSRPDTTNTEILEERQMNNINFIVKNYTWFGPANFACVIDLIYTLIAKDAANISIIRGFGTFDLVLDIARNGLPPYAKVLHNILLLINSLCLNQDFREKLASDETFYNYMKIFLNEKYAKAIKKDVGFSIGSEIAALSKTYPNLKENIVNSVVKIMNELLEKLQQTNLEEEKNYPIFMLASQFVLAIGIIAHDESTLLIDKGFFPVLLKITDLSLVPSTQFTIEPIRYVVVFKDLIRNHSSLVYEGLSEILISKLGALNAGELEFEKFSTIKNIFTLTAIIEIMSSCFEQSEDSFVEVWKNKKSDVLTNLASLESKVRLYISKSKSQIMKDEIASLKRKKPVVSEEKSLDTSTTSISSSSSTASSTTEIKPIEETQEEIGARNLRKFNNGTINSYLTLIFRFYQSLQRAIFELIEHDGQAESILKAKEIAALLVQNFSVSVTEAQKALSDDKIDWRVKATHVHSLMTLIYNVVISETYRNLNTLVLETMLSKGVIDSIMRLYIDIVNLVLSQDIKKPNKLESVDPVYIFEYESSEYAIASVCLEDFTAFLQKITSANYAAQSPITTKLFALDGFKVAELTTKVQKKVAGAVAKVWNHENLDKGSTTFLVCLINVVGHIIKGCDTSKKETSPIKEDEDKVNQLMEMGFAQKDARAALRGANNDVMVAAEWILNNTIPKEAEEEEEEEDEDELSMAIKMSMVESGMMNDEEDKTDYSVVIEEESDNWLTSRLFTKGLSYACIDVLSIFAKKKDTLKDFVVNAAIEKLTNEPSNVQEILSAMKTMMDNSDFKNVLVNRRHEFLEILLSMASKLVEEETKEAKDAKDAKEAKETKEASLMTILRFFNSLFKQKHLKDAFVNCEPTEKMTVEKLETKLQGITLTEDVEKVLELCFTILKRQKETKDESEDIIGQFATELLGNLTSSKEACTKLFNSPNFELVLKASNSQTIEQILLNIVCDKDNTKTIMRNILKRRHPKSAGSRLTVRLFLAENAALIERNPSIFFELVKEMFQINRSRFIETKDVPAEEAAATQSSSSSSSGSETAKNLLFKLISLIIAKPKESRAYLEVLGTFVNACDLYDSIIEYTNDNLDSNMKGDNKFVHFLITCFIDPPNTHSGASLLIEICSKKPHLVFNEIANILQTESSHKIITFVSTFLLQLAHAVVNPNNLAVLMIKYDILKLLIASSERIDTQKEAVMQLILSVVQKFVDSSSKNYIITKPSPSVPSENTTNTDSSSAAATTSTSEEVNTLELTRERSLGLNRI